MEILRNNEQVATRIEVLRMAVSGAQRIIDEWADKKDDMEFTGLQSAFIDLEEAVEKYVYKAEPHLAKLGINP